MLFLIFAGTVSFIAGVLFLFFPEVLRKLNKSFNKGIKKGTYYLDDKILELRIGVGVSCILVSLMCIFAVYYIIKKYG